VNPSAEWKNGGVYNYDLACHQGENDSLVIICMAGSYYGGRDEYPKKKKKKKKKKKNWSKVYIPYLIYLNKAKTP